MGGKRDPNGPPDTRMVGIVNDAFRRDIARLKAALAVPPNAETDRTKVIEHLSWLMQLLMDFHSGIDAGLYPLVRNNNPYAGDLLDRMYAAHGEIATRATAVISATEQWTDDHDDADRLDVAERFDALVDALEPHLHTVEVELMPVINASLTQRQWRSWDRACILDPQTKADMAVAGNWLLDDLDDERREITLGTISRWERMLMVRVYERRVRRGARPTRDPADAEVSSS